jgi:low molecular weight protein-tyrosine phosphatase
VIAVVMGGTLRQRHILQAMRLLFVCLGNICRSPTGEGVMRHLLRAEGLEEAVELDSAGTGDWHVGHSPDERATLAARGRGVELAGAARQVGAADFESFDLILAMDRSNYMELRALAPDAAARERVKLLREYDPEAVAAGELEVPDPYYGGDDGFEDVLDIVTRACEGLLDEVRAHVA